MADSPLLSAVLRVVTNDAVNPGDGGAVRLVSRLTPEQRAEGWEQFNVVLLARIDTPMHALPTDRDEKETRTFRLTLVEVDPSEWPEDQPVLPPPPLTVAPPQDPPRAVLVTGPARPVLGELVTLGTTRWTDADAADAGRDADPDPDVPRPTP